MMTAVVWCSFQSISWA